MAGLCFLVTEYCKYLRRFGNAVQLQRPVERLALLPLVALRGPGVLGIDMRRQLLSQAG